MSKPVFYAERKCEGRDGDCDNYAYFCVGPDSSKKYLCGVHSKKFKDSRESLPKNPHRKRDLAEKKRKMIKEAVAIGLKSKTKGKVTCFKMRMMKNADFIQGWLNIMPNFKSKGRSDGVAIPSLSPMRMGPVVHGQPGLPNAKNLENFHQGNKVFEIEVERDEKGDIDILKGFYKVQREMYLDSTPHRHKLASGKKNKALFSVWKDKNGVEKRFTYIESRQFYCNYYERFALADPDFIKLKKFLDLGINLRICGFDAYVPTKSLEEHYLDPSRPFGHELVLYTLLTVDDPEEYPWRKYKTEDF